MSRSGHRRHRLPQHCDYILVPAPSDFTPPDEKSPLPAIIVTPSSPSCSADFSVAFLAPPAKPSLFERLMVAIAPFQTKARTTLVLVLFFFVLATHLFAHRFATRHPHLRFDKGVTSFTADAALPLPPSHSAHMHHHIGWLDWNGFWQSDENTVGSRQEFVVEPEVPGGDVADALASNKDSRADSVTPLTTNL